MSSRLADAPLAMPVLSKGKHRHPRKGACFMEFASFLAGEKWSDHPACTQPLLAALARMVNDCTSDAQRPRLAELIPSVIGVTSEDPRMDVRIALRAAASALPVASAERQRVLAVAVIAGRRVFLHLDGRVPTDIAALTDAAMADVPDAARWAKEFTDGEPTTVKGFLRYSCPTAVRCAVEGIAQGCTPDPDRHLRTLLARTIDDCRTTMDHNSLAKVDTGDWSAACRITGTTTPES